MAEFELPPSVQDVPTPDGKKVVELPPLSKELQYYVEFQKTIFCENPDPDKVGAAIKKLKDYVLEEEEAAARKSGAQPAPPAEAPPKPAEEPEPHP